ncbi:MAG TPA: ribonuclease III domain-containing protein, partial [Xanthobacteraceae bacterium]|nr:ribonuclease III domain-containing protein [Xanthobacteraceae bacterium]
MSPRPSAKRTPVANQGSEPPDGGDPASSPVAAGTPARSSAKRPRRRASGLETRIGYRFGDAALLDQALTHISALTGARNRSGSYQRLEFLGDHVLGLVVSDMLFRAFPRADEGELSRRLADLVRKEACADVAASIDLGAA